MRKARTESGLLAGAERFFHSEVTGSVALLACTVIALVWANSRWAGSYFHLLQSPIGVSWGETFFHLSLHEWINDGLMAVFFFVVGLEIKRELVVGELSSARKAALPVAAAAGGMLVPACLYIAFNHGGPGAHGWGIPMATDIAFALGALAMFGARVPAGLKVLLAALAIADDLGALAVIAIFYTEKLHLGWLLSALGLLAVLLLASRSGHVWRGVLYLLIVGVWLAISASGIHSTVARILLALIVPVRPSLDPREFIEDTRERLATIGAPEISVDFLFKDHKQFELLGSIHSQASHALPPGLASSTRCTPCISGSSCRCSRSRLAFADQALAGPPKVGILVVSLASGNLGVTVLSI